MTLSRRQFVKTAGAAGAAATAVGLDSVSTVRLVGATTSGSPEITVDATVPSSTSVSITAEEFGDDTTSSALNSHTQSVDDGVNTYVYDGLEGSGENFYEFTAELSTTDETTTPWIYSLELQIPIDFDSTDYTSSSEWRAKPDHVEIQFDEELLWTFQPKLVTSPGVRDAIKGMFGYVCRSSEHDTTACCYWTQLTHQDGLPFASKDSHLGDHEPIIVFVDESAGTVEKVIFTGYHWFASEVSGDEANLSSSRTQDPTHVNLRVVDEWHNYTHAPLSEGAFFDLQSWPEVRPLWIDNGFYDPAEPAAIENPWVMETRDSWWQDGSTDHTIANIWRRIGLRDGAKDSHLRIESESSGFLGWLF